MSTRAERKIYGPANILATGQPEPQEFLSLPWSDVIGCQVYVFVDDNLDNINTISNVVQGHIGAEIVISGLIQGYASPLKRQYLTSKTGPMEYIFDNEEGYDNIRFAARFFQGGRPGPYTTLPFNNVGNLPGAITASVHVKPRSGFGKNFNG